MLRRVEAVGERDHRELEDGAVFRVVHVDVETAVHAVEVPPVGSRETRRT